MGLLSFEDATETTFPFYFSTYLIKKLVRQEKRRHINHFTFYFNFKQAGL